MSTKKQLTKTELILVKSFCKKLNLNYNSEENLINNKRYKLVKGRFFYLNGVDILKEYYKNEYKRETIIRGDINARFHHPNFSL